MHQYDQSVIERAVKENPCLLDVVKTQVKAIDCNINKRVQHTDISPSVNPITHHALYKCVTAIRRPS